MINISCLLQFSKIELKLLESNEIMSIIETKKKWMAITALLWKIPVPVPLNCIQPYTHFKTIPVQVNLEMTDSMGPGKLVRHMHNPSYTYDEYLICIRLGPSISSVLCKNLLYSGPSYPSSPVPIPLNGIQPYSHFEMIPVPVPLNGIQYTHFQMIPVPVLIPFNSIQPYTLCTFPGSVGYYLPEEGAQQSGRDEGDLWTQYRMCHVSPGPDNVTQDR